MRRLVPILLGLAACGPDSTTVIDARPAIDAARDGAVTDAATIDGATIDGAIVDAAIIDAADPIDALDGPPGIDAIDAPLPCQTPVLTFTLDGVLDASATVVAGGVTSVRLAVAFSADGRLYVATDDAGEGSDHFVLVSATPPGPDELRAPFGKPGAVAVGTGQMRFLADENDNDFEGWFRLEAVGGDTLLTGAPYDAATGANGGVVEGSVDLITAFGSVPAAVSLSAVLYATGDGGALVPAAQTPAGDGDGDVDAAEFVTFTIPCSIATN